MARLVVRNALTVAGPMVVSIILEDYYFEKLSNDWEEAGIILGLQVVLSVICWLIGHGMGRCVECGVRWCCCPRATALQPGYLEI